MDQASVARSIHTHTAQVPVLPVFTSGSVSSSSMGPGRGVSGSVVTVIISGIMDVLDGVGEAWVCFV